MFLEPHLALKHAEQMIEAGADIIDVGGESSRPGAAPVALQEELDRVIPVITAIKENTDIPVSIDTTKAGVARAALRAGAIIVNDISAMRFDEQMTSVVGKAKAGVVLMHMLGEPQTMQKDPVYDDVVSQVGTSLVEWARRAEQAGILAESIALDPGIGFGKNLAHNLALIKSAGSFGEGKYPVMAGPSRKSFIGALMDLPVTERQYATGAAVAWLAAHGANIIRVHDVAEMTQVVRMTEAIAKAAGA